MHAKEAPQLHPSTRDGSKQSRQLLAEQAKVDISTAKFTAPIPQRVNGGLSLEHRGSLPQNPYEEHPQRDMFDTDVEGVDDSTVGGTTVMDVEEAQQFQLPPSLPPSRNAQRNDISNRPLNHFRQGHRLYGSNWYENLGDKAMKSAGFDSDDADDDASQLTSSLAGDDEKASESNDWYYSHKHRPNEEPLSKRLEGFWNASKRAYPKTSNPALPESNSPALPADAKKAGQVPPPLTKGRKVTLLRSHTTTPRTRFSPPKPSLLERLDASPTRRTSAVRTKHAEKANTSTPVPQQYHLDDTDFFTSDNERRNSDNFATAFDTTNLDILDDDETIRDPFSRYTPTKRTSIGPTVPRKREFEADYPPEILYQKSFADLQAEPFDYTPAPTSTEIPEPQPEDPHPDKNDKVSFLLKLSHQDRANYLSSLSIDEWEDCGDQLVEQFSQILSKMKDLRRARRKTMTVFEAEIKRRHELVESQTSEVSKKLEDMRTGGAEVLRGSGQSS